MDPTLLIVLVVIAIVIVAVVTMYNGFVRQRLRVDESWSQITVQLKRRHGLIPNLVGAVKGYMGFEQKVLTDLTEARAGAITAGARGPLEQAEAENHLTGAIRSLFAVVENYPDLKANQNVLSLQDQLATTENQIGGSRDGYNAAVLSYNTAIQRFPATLMAGSMGFHPREFFAAEAEAAEAPIVQLT
ncbi:MAG: LemA family protein [Candidatus Limnocylindrales bacterium]